ncbi:hypothetical protein PAXRUDRAFT_824889 [Paxillus rubicundulus Ve08.2h10]|uniref:Uncharacterized protein n=1 Tax=Paxillus rubicundulus Ve08.2h10 TaxID=930991 RepID=A0A0D0E194_9AGAM|nr:hypothetical protein PAXRUDRAFT_824889 [Paxillus rubicundulus Ve08.2h10]
MSDATDRSLMTVFVLTDTTTIIMLPILLLVEFRVWLDAARLFLLLVAQTGSATAFTYWNPQIQCPDQTTDEMGVCKLINAYTLMTCWVIPAILVLYSTYFAIMIYRQSRIPVVVDTAPRKGRGSMLSMDVDLEVAEETRLSAGSASSPDAKFKQTVKTHVLGTPVQAAQHQTPHLPLLLPATLGCRRSTLPPPPRRQSTSPYQPRRQSTLPSSPQASDAQAVPPLPTIRNRHMSLPPPKNGNENRYARRSAIKVAISDPLASQAQIQKPSPYQSYPQTPSSYSSPSLSSPDAHTVNVQPGVAEQRSSREGRQGSRHLSMMSLSLSPGSSPIDSNLSWSPITRSSGAKLSKPLPAYLV